VTRSALRVFMSPLEVGERPLSQSVFRYVVRVHRLRPGDRFVAFDPEAQLEADAELTRVSRYEARCRLTGPKPARRVSALRATLMQGLGKGSKPDRVVRDATALGVEELVFVETEHTIVRPGVGGAERADRWRSISLESARQCGRGDVPRIEGPIELASALARLVGRGGPRLCLRAGAATRLHDALEQWEPSQPITLLVGPEGGLGGRELSRANECGFTLVSLGPFVLRTETAATAALGALAARIR